ncbi:MAG: hypothetical protein Q8M01_12705 [Rubrivivax sp.]|nr:hypothetical protein [Rubrivivax sp.]
MTIDSMRSQHPGDQIALQVLVTPLGAQAPGRMADAPRPAVYINPWPYLVIGRGWNGGGWHGGGGNCGHRR